MLTPGPDRVFVFPLLLAGKRDVTSPCQWDSLYPSRLPRRDAASDTPGGSVEGTATEAFCDLAALAACISDATMVKIITGTGRPSKTDLKRSCAVGRSGVH